VELRLESWTWPEQKGCDAAMRQGKARLTCQPAGTPRRLARFDVDADTQSDGTMSCHLRLDTHTHTQTHTQTRVCLCSSSLMALCESNGSPRHRLAVPCLALLLLGETLPQRKGRQKYQTLRENDASIATIYNM